MPSRRFFILTLGFLIIFTGCSSLAGNSVPTFIPEEYLPTVIEMTAQALVDAGLVTPPSPPTVDPSAITPTPSASDTPTLTLEPPLTLVPTIGIVLGTPEPITLPDPLPQAEIQIISPGRLSRVTSPFNLHVYLSPPNNDKEENLRYQISLYGVDGKLLKRESISREAGEEGSSHLVMELTFDISGEAQTARLEVSSVDPSSRISNLVSTDVILLSEGIPEIKTILDLFADMIIQQPIPSTLIQGDVLIVQGITRYAPGDEILVELINRNGNQVGSAVLPVGDEDLGNGFRAFNGEIPYQVSTSSWIRVQVIARDGKFSGIQHLSSVEVLVSP
ncbi:MAG: hypothetical protein E4H33_02545 [Anaerolineales bacterium]|nr:MAG: hypothetical protein E4H33_02545 [Anaerolineales bacterium]